MRTIDDWLAEYGESHRNPVNKVVHWICVPAIMFSLLGLAWTIPVPGAAALPGVVNWAALIALLAVAYYAFLSVPVAAGMAVVSVIMLAVIALLERAGVSLAWLSIAIFAAAWVAQFWGHHVEGRRPSFFKDVQFLLIGPAWLLAHVYRRIGIRVGGGGHHAT